MGAAGTVRDMEAEADTVVVLAAPSDFQAVGQWFVDFRQLTDADVVAALDRAAEQRGTAP